MFDPKVLDLAGRIIQVQLEELLQQLSRDLELIRNEMTMRGMGRSGAIVAKIHERCAREVEIRARIVWLALQKAFLATGVQPSESLAEDLKREVEKHLSPGLPVLNQVVTKEAELMRIPHPPSPLSDALSRALRKVGVEIDLFVQSLVSRGAAVREQGVPSSTTLVFQAPVGAVQTGPGATASVVQVLAAEDREALLQALRFVGESLVTVEKLPGSSKDEVLELVKEVGVEVQKPKPNGIRLRSILSAIATAIQTTASLQPAYQALKAALLPLGILLP
jgi:hypothetical protein